mmetsp:Transcript_39837/g.71626  ORF Transcript_39837/g.71626 Transcript_39837/m.71626 type:complete len:290 (+) Transcript_39837:83-952(+)|eukprot:CAMPEP_0197650810 /NCGR_PEP_ID=MMETSP1338-20131121/31169_1 /TAXON_ID=43686 ORGANISM="Pelagodinium beii, Strain RCC1491" /NCGR_SAMPLE_ID=MMETSP1338 /ASSEMBLY_ACC=CAM_ASM_000754 /LENGTH=289 /DNA_ID=CAMNT_0043225293 /DNA_START=76 /DNA_END=945 /DNA_ORIENTATION=+
MSDFVGKVVGAASQGAVGALVAANLSAVTEPVVNAMLVKRVPLSEALKELSIERIQKYLQTTLATNFIKFPFFEVTNMLVGGIELPPTAKGALTGTVFCTTTLPITNYRFRKSMDLPITASNLYQAYPATVLRDILYGIVRNKVMNFMIGLNPDFAKTNMGRFVNMFATVIAACWLSAPGNELRGYCLQPPDRKQSMVDFFQPAKFLRSTSVGSVIMAISLGVGTLATPQVEKLFANIKEYLAKNPVGYLLVILFALHQILENRRSKEVVQALEIKDKCSPDAKAMSKK